MEICLNCKTEEKCRHLPEHKALCFQPTCECGDFKKEYGDWRDLPNKEYEQCKFCGKFFINVKKHEEKVHGGKEQIKLL